MVYNTRRKSLSLPSLGIHLPQSSRSSPSSSATKSEPPQKRLKRDHSPLSAGGYDTTRRSNLPLSPPPESRISHEGINDEIVSGVVDVLERSGNRPHTVKELAAVLAPVLGVVEKSVPFFLSFPYTFLFLFIFIYTYIYFLFRGGEIILDCFSSSPSLPEKVVTPPLSLCRW